jgi:hypothetical protein
VGSGGYAVVHVSDKLHATVSAGAQVEYLGSPQVEQNVSPGGRLGQRAGGEIKAEPPKDAPRKGPPEAAKEPPPKGSLTVTADVDGYTQATMFNPTKYPFKYTGSSVLAPEQVKELAKAGDVPAASAKALLGCLLWPKMGDTLEKAALKSDGKKLTGEVEVLHKYGTQGTHRLTLRLEGTIEDGRLMLRALAPVVSGTWDFGGGGGIKLRGEVKITITAK